VKTKPARAKEFNSKLAAYSATATAALLAAPAADAQGTIHNITGSTASYNLATGINNFFAINAGPFHGSFSGRIEGGSNLNFNTATGVVGIKGSAKGFIAKTHVGAYSDVINFGAGEHIAGNFGNAAVLATAGSGGGRGGAFAPGINGAKTGYVGFKAGSHGSYYGWLRVKVSGNNNGVADQVSLLAVNGIIGAYDNVSDPNFSSFKAGSIVPTPEPATAALGGLGLLALGAQGVRELRRRRKQDNQN
jgi:hypothetical protein